MIFCDDNEDLSSSLEPIVLVFLFFKDCFPLSYISLPKKMFMLSCKTQLESKSRCDCQNMKQFFTDARACRHPLENHPTASELAESSETANLRDFKSLVHTHNPEFQSNSQIPELYARAEYIQHNESQMKTSFVWHWLSFQG